MIMNQFKGRYFQVCCRLKKKVTRKSRSACGNGKGKWGSMKVITKVAQKRKVTTMVNPIRNIKGEG